MKVCWRVLYIDDEGRKHMAKITDKNVLLFLQERYNVKILEIYMD